MKEEISCLISINGLSVTRPTKKYFDVPEDQMSWNNQCMTSSFGLMLFLT